MSAPNGLLRIEQLTKRFGGLVAVDDFSIQVSEEELVSIIGPNGAGKTTVLNLIMGMIPPSSGTILFRGQNIVGRRPNAIAELGISRTFQGIRLFRNMTALENLMGAQYCRTKAGTLDAVLHTPRYRQEMKDMTDRALFWLDFVGLTEATDSMAGSLSYGDQRRLEVARSLATKPEIVLLDEPAAGMNEVEIQEMIDLIVRLRTTGVTIVLVEHQMGLVMGISDRVCVLNFGKKIAEDTPASIRENAEVIEAYLGKDITV